MVVLVLLGLRKSPFCPQHQWCNYGGQFLARFMGSNRSRVNPEQVGWAPLPSPPRPITITTDVQSQNIVTWSFGNELGLFSVWRCWLGGRKGIRPVKNWVVGCWRGYLSGARCRLAYGPADATATHTVSCFSKIQIGFTFLVPAYLGSPGQRTVKRVWVSYCIVEILRTSYVSWQYDIYTTTASCAAVRKPKQNNFQISARKPS